MGMGQYSGDGVGMGTCWWRQSGYGDDDSRGGKGMGIKWWGWVLNILLHHPYYLLM